MLFFHFLVLYCGLFLFFSFFNHISRDVQKHQIPLIFPEQEEEEEEDFNFYFSNRLKQIFFNFLLSTIFPG